MIGKHRPTGVGIHLPTRLRNKTRLIKKLVPLQDKIFIPPRAAEPEGKTGSTHSILLPVRIPLGPCRQTSFDTVRVGWSP